ncbi:MAG: hypothetical protein JO080_00470 [Mucilaginibacter sp.]|nr:hypothetical protein [Mucilaginibacter sp.]
MDQFLKKCLLQDSNLTFTHDFPVIGTKTITITAKPSTDKETKETLMVIIVVEENHKHAEH